jgi:hypothetical protein
MNSTRRLYGMCAPNKPKLKLTLTARATTLTTLQPGERCFCNLPAVTFAPDNSYRQLWRYAPVCEHHRNRDWERQNKPAKGDGR